MSNKNVFMCLGFADSISNCFQLMHMVMHVCVHVVVHQVARL